MIWVDRECVNRNINREAIKVPVIILRLGVYFLMFILQKCISFDDRRLCCQYKYKQKRNLKSVDFIHQSDFLYVGERVQYKHNKNLCNSNSISQQKQRIGEWINFKLNRYRANILWISAAIQQINNRWIKWYYVSLFFQVFVVMSTAIECFSCRFDLDHWSLQIPIIFDLQICAKRTSCMRKWRGA